MRWRAGALKMCPFHSSVPYIFVLNMYFPVTADFFNIFHEFVFVFASDHGTTRVILKIFPPKYI